MPRYLPPEKMRPYGWPGKGGPYVYGPNVFRNRRPHNPSVTISCPGRRHSRIRAASRARRAVESPTGMSRSVPNYVYVRTIVDEGNLSGVPFIRRRASSAERNTVVNTPNGNDTVVRVTVAQYGTDEYGRDLNAAGYVRARFVGNETRERIVVCRSRRPNVYYARTAFFRRITRWELSRSVANYSVRTKAVRPVRNLAT